MNKQYLSRRGEGAQNKRRGYDKIDEVTEGNVVGSGV